MRLFQNLNAVTGRHKVESVHHADYPVSNPAAIDTELEERMQLAQDTSSLVLSLRKKVNIKVRQPLQKVLIPVLDKHMKYADRTDRRPDKKRGERKRDSSI